MQVKSYELQQFHKRFFLYGGIAYNIYAVFVVLVLWLRGWQLWVTLLLGCLLLGSAYVAGRRSIGTVSRELRAIVEIMNQILEQLGTYGIVPVVVLQDAAKAEPLAEALCKGGLACAEVTFRTDAAEESIRIMSEKFPEMLVGAGTVLTTEQADRAVKAGAKFIVSPGLNPEVVKWCQAHEVPVIPGIVTPTEMEQAIGLGLTMVKFFPAEPAGGLKYIRAIAAPYTMMKFMPTGGINPQNVREYLAYDRIAACGGSWMVKNTMIENNEFDRIEELVKEAVEIVKESRT